MASVTLLETVENFQQTLKISIPRTVLNYKLTECIAHQIHVAKVYFKNDNFDIFIKRVFIIKKL